ncbi:MBL fold metallo-hydrolase [Paracoccus sp. YIM 132242]|uniref:MBL fold metallo-hydrolase n=1 Tax=Paracoccus lichenicola TaxID=2665644 RepID=A0A6L6HPY5_9RHOB|nr:MBL fold metallo-hydrolase [Paracoccus lichenicola]MTE01234.1 MBL fold metallo-hydrolase [Paracoccus lichenicola]
MIPPRLHATLDAASAAMLVLMPHALRWPARLSRPLALAGLGVAAYSLATRYRQGPGSGLDLDQHRLLDAAQGAACLAAGLRETRPGPRAFLTGYGGFSLAAAALTSPEGPQGIPLPASATAEALGPDLMRLRCGIVNVAFIGAPGAGDRAWFLVDAGIAGSASFIRAAARARYGTARPAAILMTHGHFDHVGALEQLAREWDTPVLAHPDERPFLDGTRSYPPPAPEVGGGLMAELSPLFPRSPIDIADRLADLPGDGTIPGLEGWRWIHTPGHAPGHVSFWHEATGRLVAGDAISTTQQESMASAALQTPKLQGPPAYFTTDWQAAGDSVRRLAALRPRAMIAGHGPALAGADFQAALDRLAGDFTALGLPRDSRYAPGLLPA